MRSTNNADNTESYPTELLAKITSDVDFQKYIS